jgi:son of sevenless-like protein
MSLAVASKSKSRPSGNSKLAKILGADYAATVPSPPEPELPPRPWYLQPTYSPTEILIEPDGTVRAGTVPALVERLTAHEQGGMYIHATLGCLCSLTCSEDPTFIKSFLMTFKSFTTVDDLFDLLVQRFWIQPPPKLTPTEREEWGKLKQHVIQIRSVISSTSLLSTYILQSFEYFQIYGCGR